MNSPYKSLGLWLMVIMTFLLAYNLFHKPVENRQNIAYSELLDKVKEGKVEQLEIQGSRIQGTFTDEGKFESYAPDDPEFLPSLRQHGVKVVAAPAQEDPLWKSILISWVPMLLLVGLWFFAMRQMQAGTGKAMSFGKSRAKLLNENEHPVTFKDVAGVDEAKEELEEIILFLKNPKRFTRFGGRIPKGVLLIGPPGTGKTLLARAVAGEAERPFFSISGSDFVEMFVGVGASRVRDLFLQAKKQAPCIIFIDEIDAVGRHRGAGLGGGHDEREQTLNQLLVEMDGFESNEGVILIAATNRPDVLDPALLRPGRFDRRVVVPLPDWKGRLQILKVHVDKKKVPIDVQADLETIARGTPGFSGADIENIVNEAALLAARKEEREMVLQVDLDEAKDKVLMGAERRSIVLSKHERRVTAIHEAGHALVARLLPETDPVHKITIIPRGMALGLTQQLPVQDIHNYTRTYLVNRLAVIMGGRAAEEIVYGERTTGAGNDIQQGTDLARKMVCQWGMSEVVGPWGLVMPDHEVFLGRDIARDTSVSNETAALVDREVSSLLENAYKKALELLKGHRLGLDAVSTSLLEKETLSGVEMESILGAFGYDLPIQPISEYSEMQSAALLKAATDGNSSPDGENNLDTAAVDRKATGPLEADSQGS